MCEVLGINTRTPNPTQLNPTPNRTEQNKTKQEDKKNRVKEVVEEAEAPLWGLIFLGAFIHAARLNSR